MSSIDISDGIAVIGMSCRFPGARNTDEFWQNLKNGLESITCFSDDDLIESGIDQSVFNSSNYVKKGFIIEKEDLFDAGFFGYSPREAEIMDPQHRLFMEIAWKTLEDSGYSPFKYKGAIGVFAGSKISTYLLNLLNNQQPLSSDISGFQTLIGNDKDYLTTRVSYKLALNGPSVNVQSACSTSLVSVHLACESLLSGACDMALAGGTALIVPQKSGYLYQEGMVLSPDGHCRAFDSNAKGISPGNGVGAVLLKRFEDAVDDRDCIHAVIRGSAINNDGANKVGYTTPSVDGQAKVIREAIAVSGIKSESISYIETHGTGTDLGDPVEIEALKEVFNADTDKKGFCAIGSVKTNIGHLDTAAGVSGLIKTILSLKHKKIPPSLNFSEPNPKIDFEQTPFFVNTELSEWKKNGYPRRAGVSSFGFGGTNAHVIIEEAPEIDREPNDIERPFHLLTLSAKSKHALEEQVLRYKNYINENKDISIGDLCYTANVGRTHFPYRSGFVGASLEDFFLKLNAFEESSYTSEYFTGYCSENSKPEMVFLFTGQGSQYFGMGRELYDTDLYFRKTMDQCDDILNKYLDCSILSIIWGNEKDNALINKTIYTQPALFTLEYSLAKMILSWGIKPFAVMGHSVGEYVAACIAGVMNLEDGLKLIAARGRLMQEIKGKAAMYSVFAGEEYVSDLVSGYSGAVSIAAANGPENTVISGMFEPVEEIVKRLDSEGIASQNLNVSHAFHSPMMKEMLSEFRKVLKEISFSTPKIPVVSNLTGEFVEKIDEEYWCSHVLEPVKFASGIKTLQKRGYEYFLEIGPTPIILGMGKQCLPEDYGFWSYTLKKGGKDWSNIVNTLGELYVKGVDIDWDKFDEAYNRYRISLPTYPFERKRYWASKPTDKNKQLMDFSEIESDGGFFTGYPDNDKNLSDPILGGKVQTPLSEIIFEQKLSHSTLLTSLKDHRIFGDVVYPAGALLELIMAGGKEIFKTSDLVLKNVFIMEPLIFKEDNSQTTLQIVFLPEGKNQSIFKIYSLTSENKDQSENWKQHFTGDLIKSQPEKIPEPLSEIQARCNKVMEVKKIYCDLEKSGQLMGNKKLQCLDFLSYRENEAIGKISFPQELMEEAYHYNMPPGFLDPCFHIWLGMLLNNEQNDLASDVYLPVGIEEVRYFKKAEDQLWSHVSFRGMDFDKENFNLDIALYDLNGNPVCKLSGLSMRLVNQEMILKNMNKKLSYEVSWHPCEISVNESEQPDTNNNNCWVILGDETVLAEELSKHIEDSGDIPIIISTKAYVFVKNGDKSEFLKEILRNKIVSAKLNCRGIVSLWGVDNYSLENLTSKGLKEITRFYYNSTASLIQAIVSLEVEVPKLCFVTRNCHSITSKDKPDSLPGSVLWGLRKVIALEHPEFKSLAVDLDLFGKDNDAEKLWQQLQVNGNEQEIAFRDGQRLVSRLVRSSSDNNKEKDAVSFESGGTYVITGGLGGMGLETAKWLSGHGAGNIVLLGRNEPTLEALEKIKEIEENKTNVLIKTGDVKDQKIMSEMFNEIRSSMPSLKGIFHLAGVLEEGDLLGKKPLDIDSVMAPKVEGAWNLHLLTLDDPLDYFVMFSSISSLWGGHGLGAYTSANAFLDALSHYRRANNFPSLSINWGAFSKVGMIAGDELGNTLREKAGISSFNAGEALSHMGLAMCKDLPQICITKIKWESLFDYQFQDIPPYFLKLQDSDNAEINGVAKERNTILNEMLNSSSSEGVELLQTYLINKVADSLHVDVEEIEKDSDLIQMGMDSLIFLDLSNTLAKELKVKIPPHKLFKDPTIKALIKMFAKGIFGEKKDEETGNEVITDFRLSSDIKNRFEPFDLTDIQQAYWVGRHGVMGMGKISCHTYYEIDIKDLDKDRYLIAWEKLIERHEMLRLVILGDGKQKILEKVPEFEIEYFDLTGEKSDLLADHLDAIRKKMSHQVFKSDDWPLFEVKITRIDEKKSRLHVGMDLLIADAHSIRLIFNELNLLYKNPDYNFDPLNISFRDYVLNYENFKKSGIYKKSKEYWLKRLSTLPKSPELPIIKRLQEIEDPHFVRRTSKLEVGLWSKIKEIASKSGITPSGFLLAAYSAILSKWSKNNDFSINLTIFNRLPVHEEINEIVGDFTSVIFLEVQNQYGKSFKSHAVDIQNQLWNDVEHRFFSGVGFLRELAQSKNNGSMEIMPVVFTSNLVSNNKRNSILNNNMFGMEGEVVYGISQTPQVWMDLQVSENNGELIIFLDAVEEIFPDGLLDDMFSAYRKLIKAHAENQDLCTQTNFELMPVNQLEKKKKINSETSKIAELSLHELFEKQALENPENIAVTTSSHSITYGELLKLSDNLAQELYEKGAKPNTLIAVIMEKGWEQVVAVLGVLKSGAAYLPIDPDIPEERLLNIAEDGEVKLALTQSWLEEKFELPGKIECFSVDKISPIDRKTDLTAKVKNQEKLAYVIYTSGSTGAPKGVMIDHKGAVNTILDINRRFKINSKDKVFALSNLNFDLSVYDIFGTLAAGATIVVPDNPLRKDPGHWLDLINRENVTIWNSVPMLMQMLVEHIKGQNIKINKNLRLALLSGDWIPLDLPDKIRKLFKDIEVISLGGATEASIWSILYPIKAVDSNWNSIPYGKPMMNQRIYILNKNFDLCPDWVTGTIYIGGAGLAKGYWKDKKKTEKSFITHPLTGEHLYKTGDYGRYLPDGNIEFLGREDFQIKIDGYRIELGEIESAVNQYPDIKASVVNVAETRGGAKYLVGYVVTKEKDFCKDDITDFLGKKLPHYMVPDLFIVMESFPLTDNGKVDIKKLQLPDIEKIKDKPYEAPENELEEQILNTVQKVLQVDKISINERFFNLGANSLDLVKIQNVLAKELMRDLSVIDLFEHSTIKALANFIGTNKREFVSSIKISEKVNARKAAALKRKKRY